MTKFFDDSMYRPYFLDSIHVVFVCVLDDLRGIFMERKELSLLIFLHWDQ